MSIKEENVPVKFTTKDITQYIESLDEVISGRASRWCMYGDVVIVSMDYFDKAVLNSYSDEVHLYNEIVSLIIDNIEDTDNIGYIAEKILAMTRNFFNKDK